MPAQREAGCAFVPPLLCPCLASVQLHVLCAATLPSELQRRAAEHTVVDVDFTAIACQGCMKCPCVAANHVQHESIMYVTSCNLRSMICSSVILKTSKTLQKHLTCNANRPWKSSCGAMPWRKMLLNTIMQPARMRLLWTPSGQCQINITCKHNKDCGSREIR